MTRKIKFISLFIVIAMILSMCLASCGTSNINDETDETKTSDTYKEMPGYFYCDQISKSMTGGSYYYVKDLEGFNRKIWICLPKSKVS